MIKTVLIALSGAVLVLASEAQAFSLTNRDDAEQRLQIVEGGDEAVAQDVVIAADQKLDDVCREGCTIKLESGEQESFEGDEVVHIEDGRFVIAE